MDAQMEGIEKIDSNTGQRTYMGEVGVRGLERYGGYIYEEFLSNLRMPQSLKVYKEMSTNDATIGSLLFIYEQLILKAGGSVQPAGKKRIDKQLANFVTECMDDMSHTWSDFINEATSCFIYGWSWHELVYKMRKGDNRDTDLNSKFNDNRIGWAKIPIRSQSSWSRWVYDDINTDKLIGMEQNAANVGKSVVIPWEKSLHFVTKSNRGNPEGVSLLRTAYRSYYFKKKEEELEGIGMERNLAGLPVITPPLEAANLFDETNPQMVALLNSLKTMVSNIRMDKFMGVILPPGYELELKSSGSGQRQSDTNAIINRWDQRIAMSLLADLILLGADKAGNFALADVKKSLLAAALETQLQNIANVINKFAIPRLIKLNSFTGYTDYPQWVPGEIEAPDMIQLADAMTRFTTLGMGFFPQDKTEDYITNSLGLPKLTDDEIEERNKIIEENKKKLDILQNLGNTTNSDNNKGTNDTTKPLTQRETKPKVTDNKEKFNSAYESAGLKTKQGGGRSNSHA